jgi:hypothetical protein
MLSGTSSAASLPSVRFAALLVIPPRHDEGMIEDLTLEVKRLAEEDPRTLADDDTIVALHRLTTQLEAVKARATAAWEARRGYAHQHRTAASWLTALCHVPRGDAQRTLKLGRACRVLPEAERAWLAGEITGHHVGLLASKRNERTAARMADDEVTLVGHAKRLTFRCFTRALRYWELGADPDGADEEAARQHDERRVHLSQTFEDRWQLDGLLEPIGGSIVETTLKAIYEELFQADWAEARARLGDDVRVDDLCRTPAQRRHDAMVEMATRARTAPRDGRRPAPLFSVFVGYETFADRLCELADGTVLPPGTLAPWLAEADIERVVFDGPSRVIDVGVTKRFFTGGTRRSVELRDLGRCYVDGCDEPAEHIDHTLPFAAGGLTAQENGRGACRFHNLLRNRRPVAP